MDRQGWQLRWVDTDAIDPADIQDDQAQPITLEKSKQGYVLVSGRALLDEAITMGLKQVEAVIRPPVRLEARLSALLTGMAEGRLDFFQEAESYQALMDMGGLTQRALGEQIGKSQASIQRKLRLLGLSPKTRQAVKDGGLSEQQALLLLRIPGEQGRLRMARHIAKESLNGVQAEQLIEETLSRMPIPMPKERRLMPLMRDYRLYLNAFRGIVEQMRDAGLDAEMTMQKGIRIVELRVTVPVFQSKAR